MRHLNYTPKEVLEAQQKALEDLTDTALSSLEQETAGRLKAERFVSVMRGHLLFAADEMERCAAKVGPESALRLRRIAAQFRHEARVPLEVVK